MISDFNEILVQALRLPPDQCQRQNQSQKKLTMQIPKGSASHTILLSRAINQSLEVKDK